MNEREVKTYTENVILIEENGKLVGFVKNANGTPSPVIYECVPLDSEGIARLIDSEHGVITRKIRESAH